ncbi:hypothetical protein MRX96_032291 [Rhipicephalus microplus]
MKTTSQTRREKSPSSGSIRFPASGLRQTAEKPEIGLCGRKTLMAPRGSRKKKKNTNMQQALREQCEEREPGQPSLPVDSVSGCLQKAAGKRWAKRSRSAAKNLTSPHPPEESSPVDVLSNASEADCSPDANAQSKALERGSLLLTEVEVDAQQFTLTCVAETQTDPVCCKGPLQFMLSATDGTHGSTQVTHVAQADKVTHSEKTWARRCGFLG